jgi:hypothetical protein
MTIKPGRLINKEQVLSKNPFWYWQEFRDPMSHRKKSREGMIMIV